MNSFLMLRITCHFANIAILGFELIAAVDSIIVVKEQFLSSE